MQVQLEADNGFLIVKMTRQELDLLRAEKTDAFYSGLKEPITIKGVAVKGTKEVILPSLR